MDSIPSCNDTDWIKRTYKNQGSKSIVEFFFERHITKIAFKLSFNCSSSCWRSMVQDPNEIMLVSNAFNDNIPIKKVPFPLTIPSLPHDSFCHVCFQQKNNCRSVGDVKKVVCKEMDLPTINSNKRKASDDHLEPPSKRTFP